MGNTVPYPRDFHSPPPNPQQTLQEWQSLASQSSQSANYKQIATKLANDVENREIVLNFRGEDAAVISKHDK